MRYLLAMLIVFAALPCYALNQTYYVQPYHPNAKNVTVANGGGTADTPWISPSYGVAQITGVRDTIYIYPGNPGSDSYYYNDYIDYSGETISFCGVSAGGDSPTFSKGRTFYFYKTTASCAGIVISGFRFTNANFNGAFNYIGSADIGNICVRDNIFDSLTDGRTYKTDAAIYLQAYHASGNRSVYIYNNSFFDIDGCAAIAIANSSASADTVNVYAFNNTIRGCTTVVIALGSAAGNDVSCTVDNCIIDSCYALFGVSTAGNQVLNFRYCDTYNVIKTEYDISKLAALSQYTFSNCYNVDPQWAAPITGDTAAWAYLQSSTTIIDSSSTGGLIGVPWGWSPSAPTSTARRRPTMVETFRQLLFGR